MTFLFWLSAVYTVALFGVQLAEFLTAGRFHIDVSVANAFYLGLLSAYVGGKEVKRWMVGVKPPEAPAASIEGQSPPFRLSGEWFVGLWAVFLLVANIASQIWPARLAYPKGLTLIAFEVLGFYIGSIASRWLNVQVDEKTHRELERELETEKPPKGGRWVSRKRERYEKAILELAKKKDGLRREDIESLLGLSRAASLRILGGLTDQGSLKRTGDVGSTQTLYQAV